MAGQPIGVGEREIAERLGVAAGTVHQWRKRGLLPDPEFTVSRMPAWWWPTIEAWARSTGRLPGLREAALAEVVRQRRPTTPIALSLIRAGQAKTVPQVQAVLTDLEKDGLIGREMPDRWAPNPLAPLDRLTAGERRILAPVAASGGQARATAWSTMELAGSVAILGDIVSPAVPAEHWEAEGPQAR